MEFLWCAPNKIQNFVAFKADSTCARNSDGVTPRTGDNLNIVLTLALLRPSSRREM